MMLTVDFEAMAGSQRRIASPLSRHLLQMIPAHDWFLVNICLKEGCGREESVEAVAFWGLQFDSEGILSPIAWVSQGDYIGPYDDTPTKRYETRLEYRPGGKPLFQDCLYDEIPQRGRDAP